MDERTILNLASFYEAIMKTNKECEFGSSIYLYIIIFIIILLVGIIIYMYMHPRIVFVPIKAPDNNITINRYRPNNDRYPGNNVTY